jgi:hypothetical protein
MDARVKPAHDGLSDNLGIEDQMAIYTVHEPPEKRRESRRGPERFRFVRDGFYFWALVLAPFWMLWRRLFLVFIGYVLLSVALNVAMHFAQAPDAAKFATQTLLSLLVGLEAGSLRRWTLRRRGWRDLGIVSADNVEAAERRFFDAWEGGSGAVQAAPAAPTSFLATARPLTSSPGVIGLFPEPGTSR